MASSSHSARWSDEEVSALLPTLLEQKTVGNWAGTGPNSCGLKETSAVLQSRFSISKTTKQIKNKYESLKSEFSCWTKLRSSETGLGWDYHTGTIQATEEWWIRKIKEDPIAKKFKNRGPIQEDLQSQLFGNSLATGINHWTPGSTHFLADQARDQRPDLNFEYSMEAQNHWSPGESAMNVPAADSPRLSGEKRKQSEGSGGSFDEIKQLLSSRTLNVNYNTHADTEWDEVFAKLDGLFGDDTDNPLYTQTVKVLQDDCNKRKVFIRYPRKSLMSWINTNVIN